LPLVDLIGALTLATLSPEFTVPPRCLSMTRRNCLVPAKHKEKTDRSFCYSCDRLKVVGIIFQSQTELLSRGLGRDARKQLCEIIGNGPTSARWSGRGLWIDCTGFPDQFLPKLKSGDRLHSDSILYMQLILLG
jgi:hypothetical protein